MTSKCAFIVKHNAHDSCSSPFGVRVVKCLCLFHNFIDSENSRISLFNEGPAKMSSFHALACKTLGL